MIKNINVGKETYLRLFPNPNADKKVTAQYLTNDKSAVTITLRNAQGKAVATWQPKLTQYDLATSITLDLTPYPLAKGLYFISITTDNKTLTQKLILE